MGVPGTQPRSYLWTNQEEMEKQKKQIWKVGDA